MVGHFVDIRTTVLNQERMISLSTSSVNPLRAERAFQVAKHLGYEGIELMVSPSKETQNVDQIKALVDKYELPVTSVHAPTLLLCKFVWGMDPAGKLMKSVRHAERLGARSVVVHPPFKNSAYAKVFLDYVNRLQDMTDIKICVENMFPWVGREQYGPSWEETCEKAPYLTFDFSHAALSGMNVMEFFNEWSHKVQVIHYTDGSTRDGHKDSIKDEHKLPGEGDMPLQEVYEHLNRTDWAGETVLEIDTKHNPSMRQKLPALRHSIQHFNMVNNQPYDTSDQFDDLLDESESDKQFAYSLRKAK